MRIMHKHGLTQPRKLGAAAQVLAAALAISACAPAAEPLTIVPAPSLDEPASSAPRETAVLAGGCFWGVQGVFQHVKGVLSATSGYTGGARASADYETVASGRTGHAESVKITYDPQQISYGDLLQIYFSVVHDPTELDRQGPDRGSQYRSAVFPLDASQQHIAEAYIAQLAQAHVFAAPIVTRIEMDRTFYPAEAYHQNFLALHPHNGYIVANDLPKIARLEQVFPARYRASPVLVTTAAP